MQSTLFSEHNLIAHLPAFLRLWFKLFFKNCYPMSRFGIQCIDYGCYTLFLLFFFFLTRLDKTFNSLVLMIHYCSSCSVSGNHFHRHSAPHWHDASSYLAKDVWEMHQLLLCINFIFWYSFCEEETCLQPWPLIWDLHCCLVSAFILRSSLCM